MRRVLLITALLLALPGGAAAQFTYKWTPVSMDSQWDDIKDPRATQTIEKYNALVAPLQEIVGYSDEEYDKRRPESGLSNFAADVIRAVSEQLTGEHVDAALTNFGGIRTSLPKGAVRVYDIYSIFPFDNYVLTFDIKGSDLRRFLTQMAGRRVEAVSGIRMEIKDHKPVMIEVGGAPLDDDKTYKFATINFLMDGGDGVVLSDVAFNRKETDIWLRDAIVAYLRAQMARGERIVLKKDGRVKYLDEKEEMR
jgi:2',3'-cyclic-nucleotide 2'-phosphodiesterase (5'-nucleotidase family)